MNTNEESMTREKLEPRADAAKHAPVHVAHEEPTATKPPLVWMVLPLILIGLAIYFAR